MKKLALGCGLVLLLIGIGLGIAGYYAYRQVSSTFAQFAELAEVPRIESEVELRGYTPPESGELSEAQIERLVRVQAAIREHLGQQFATLEKKYKTLVEKEDATVVDLPALAAAYRDIASAWIEAKRVQVKALNDAKLSLEEYRWIRDQAYRALGLALMDLDVGRIAEDIREGRTTTEAGRMIGSLTPDGPEINRKLIERVRKQLEENLALASLGL